MTDRNCSLLHVDSRSEVAAAVPEGLGTRNGRILLTRSDPAGSWPLNIAVWRDPVVD